MAKLALLGLGLGPGVHEKLHVVFEKAEPLLEKGVVESVLEKGAGGGAESVLEKGAGGGAESVLEKGLGGGVESVLEKGAEGGVEGPGGWVESVLEKGPMGGAQLKVHFLSQMKKREGDQMKSNNYHPQLLAAAAAAGVATVHLDWLGETRRRSKSLDLKRRCYHPQLLEWQTNMVYVRDDDDAVVGQLVSFGPCCGSYETHKLVVYFPG